MSGSRFRVKVVLPPVLGHSTESSQGFMWSPRNLLFLKLPFWTCSKTPTETEGRAVQGADNHSRKAKWEGICTSSLSHSGAAHAPRDHLVSRCAQRPVLPRRGEEAGLHVVGTAAPTLLMPPVCPAVRRDPARPEQHVPGGHCRPQHPQHVRGLQPVGRDQEAAWLQPAGQEGAREAAWHSGHRRQGAEVLRAG